METSKDNRYPDFQLFRGLQRPLEFMGLQGRYIYWAAASAGGGLLGFIIAYCIAGFVAGLVILAASITVGAALILIRQRKGLTSRKEDKGYFIIARTRRL